MITPSRCCADTARTCNTRWVAGHWSQGVLAWFPGRGWWRTPLRWSSRVRITWRTWATESERLIVLPLGVSAKSACRTGHRRRLALILASVVEASASTFIAAAATSR
jgi:hypothetical protein